MADPTEINAGDEAPSITRAPTISPPNPDLIDSNQIVSQGLINTIDKAYTEVAGLYGKLYDASKDDLGRLAELYAKSFVEFANLEVVKRVVDPLQQALGTVEALAKESINIGNVIQGVVGVDVGVVRDFYGMGSISRHLAETTYDAMNELSNLRIMIDEAAGVTIDMLGDGEPTKVLKPFTEAALRDTRLFVAASEGMSAEIVKRTALASRQLGMTSRDLNEVLQRELSATGKITGEYVLEFERSMLAITKATGLSAELVTQDLNRMLQDFDNFGMMVTENFSDTLASMGSLSATIHQLGLDLDDVTRAANAFSTFDKAAQSMSNLAAATGVTLDALEMFELANTDREAFILRLREELDAQGLEFSEMNFIQQKIVAQAFGIDPIVLQRLLSDNMGAIESARAAISDKQRELQDEKEIDRILASMSKFQKVDVQETAKKLASLKDAAIGYAESITEAYKVSSKISIDLIDRSAVSLDNYSKKIAASRDILDEYVKTYKENAPPPAGATAPIPEPVRSVSAETGSVEAVTSVDDTPGVQYLPESMQFKFAQGDYVAAAQTLPDLYKQVIDAMNIDEKLSSSVARATTVTGATAQTAPAPVTTEQTGPIKVDVRIDIAADEIIKSAIRSGAIEVVYDATTGGVRAATGESILLVSGEPLEASRK